MKKIIKSKSKTKTFWYMSYFLLLALFVVSILIVSQINQSIQRKINDKYCQSVFDGISNNIVEMVKRSNNMLSVFLDYPELENVLSVSDLDGYYQEPSAKRLLQQMTMLKGECDFYIYFPNTDVIHSESGFYTSAEYYKLKIKEFGIEYDEWLKSFYSEKQKNLFSLKNNEAEYFFLSEKIQPLTDENVVLVTRFEGSSVFSSLNPPRWVNEGDIYVSNLKGDIYFSHSNFKTEKAANVKEIIQKYPDDWAIFEKKEFSTIAILVTIAYPEKIAWFEFDVLGKMQFLLLVFFVLLSLVVIIYTIRRNYKPITSVLKMLDKEGSRNEYKDIETAVRELVDKNRYYLRQADNLSNEKNQIVLAKCLAENWSENYILKELSDNNIAFKSDYFTVCAFEVDDISALFGIPDFKLPPEQKFKELLLVLRNIFAELFEHKGFNCELVTVGKQIVAIINIVTEEDWHNGTVYEVLKYGISFVEKHFQVGMSFVLSDAFCGMGKLSEAYKQAEHLLKYKKALDINSPITTNDLEVSGNEDLALFFNSNTENKLINCVASGNLEGALFLIDNYFSEMKRLELSLEYIQCFMIDLGCTLFKIPQSEVEIDLKDILENSKNVTKMREYMYAKVKEICQVTCVNSSKADKSAQVKEYIDKNYCKEMNLDTLSLHFGISTRYLSKSFKNAVGIAPLDYINKTRIHHAKELLKNTNIQIKDVAKSVGYDNLRSFNRIFLNYVGTTPSEYRNSTK